MLKSILTILCLLFAAPAWGAVTVGNFSTADTGASLTETGLTWSHNSNGDALIVGLSFFVWGGTNQYSEAACTVTYNGDPMTKVDGFGHVSIDGLAIEAWKLAAPTAGANNVMVSCSVAVVMVGGAQSVTNAHQTVMTGTPVRVDSGFTATPSAVVTSATGELVFAVVHARSDFTDCTAGSSETELWDVLTTGTGAILSCGFTEPGAASVTIEPTLNGTENYRSMLAFAINEAGAAPVSTRHRQVMILP